MLASIRATHKITHDAFTTRPPPPALMGVFDVKQCNILLDKIVGQCPIIRNSTITSTISIIVVMSKQLSHSLFSKCAIIFVLSILTIETVLSQRIACGGQLTNQQNELEIPTNIRICEFTTAPGTKELMLDTDSLFLAINDKLTITSKNADNPYTHSPPTDAGYLHIGGAYVEPSLNFTFERATTSPMVIKYSVNKGGLIINVDINHNFKIKNVGISPSLDFNFTKTLNETVHIELEPAQLTRLGTLGNYLMGYNESNKNIYGNLENLELIHVRTTIVDKTCSNIFSPLTKPQELSGPQNTTLPYQCVNLFKFADKSPQEAHFDVDFANFISLDKDGDELIMKDSSQRLFIGRSSERDFVKRKISSTGQDLVIIYRSTDIINHNNPTGLKLTVIPENQGGIVRTEQDILLPANILTSFTLVPDEFACVSLMTTNQKILGDANLTLSSEQSSESKFGPNTLLPPVIGTSKQSEQLIVTYSGKTDLKLHFSPKGSCCHKLSSDSIGRFSVDGGQKDPCYWTLATGKDVSINFDKNDLSPDGCITIQSLTTNKPLYSRCNIKPNEIIPNFVVSHAYVNVTLPNKDTKFTSSLVTAPAKISLYDDGSSTSYITSPGYPVSYPIISNEKEVYSLNATKKNYLISVVDLDLRTGEKLQIGKLEIDSKSLVQVGDLFANTTLNFTLTRPVPQADLNSRRGLKIAVISIDEFKVFSGNTSSNNSIVLNNPSNTVIKISPQKSSSKQLLPSDKSFQVEQLQFRVNYAVTSSKALPESIELKTYDGRSISGPESGSLNGSLTSDTMMLIAKATKSGVKIPPLTITYWYSPCNADDLVCDLSTRCVPRDYQCKGKFYCNDGADTKVVCSSVVPVPPPPPPAIQNGFGGFTVFILCTLMLTLGVLLSTYGPGIYKTLEDRFRGSGQYNSFTSVE